MIFDRQKEGEEAWVAPFILNKRLVDAGWPPLSARSVSRMRTPQLARLIHGNRGTEKALHHSCNEIAKALVFASRKIVAEYGGDASRIRDDRPTARELVLRFDEFYGIGQKLYSMAARILVEDYNVPITGDRSALDISLDRHVRRVFIRTGLVERDDGPTIVRVAQKLHPDFPGVLDIPTWRIGSEWCHPSRPDCQSCPIRLYCPKKRRYREVVP